MPVVAISLNNKFVLESQIEKGPVLEPVLLYDFFLDTVIGHCRVALRVKWRHEAWRETVARLNVP